MQYPVAYSAALFAAAVMFAMFSTTQNVYLFIQKTQVANILTLQEQKKCKRFFKWLLQA